MEDGTGRVDYLEDPGISEELQSGMAPIVGIANSFELFSKLKHDAELWKKSWGAYGACNFLITAYHLHYDWAKNDPIDSLSKTKRTQSLPPELTMFWEGIRHLANGSKHLRLKEDTRNEKVSKVHTGREANWFSYFVHENLPGVTFSTGHYFSVRSICKIVIAYFEWVFDDNRPFSPFPNDIVEAINYGLLSNRVKSSYPSLLKPEHSEVHS